jgi:HNH endonuclease
METALREKSISGYADYSIREDGAVFSHKKGKRRRLAAIKGKNGYLHVSLWMDNKGKLIYIHHLLLSTFVSPRPDGCECLHANGDRTDNCLDNLRWGTRKENVGDMIGHGTATTGAKNKMASLSANDVRKIRSMRERGIKGTDLAKQFGVHRGTIYRVNTRETYKDI